MSASDSSDLRQPRRFEDLLLFRLHRLLSLASAPVIRLCEGLHGITRREWGLIATLAQHGPLQSSELARRLGLDPARTSKGVTSLRAKGLVNRTPGGGDRRQAIVSLAPAGLALHDRLFPQVVAINTRLVQALASADIQALDRCLDQLLDGARRQRGTTAVDLKAQRRLGARRPTVARRAVDQQID